MQGTFFEDEVNVNTFIVAISKHRLRKYLQEAKGSLADALKLYLWNSLQSQSLYFCLLAWETLFRNRMNYFFAWKYGERWPWSAKTDRDFSGKDRVGVQESIDRLASNLGSTPTTDQVVADLSAGFWVSQLGSNYQAQYYWKNNIKFRIFTNDHSTTREDASAISDDLPDLRNRVAHHEPIFHLELEDLRKDLVWLIEGMCPATANYLDPNQTFDQLWAGRPVFRAVKLETSGESLSIGWISN